MKDLIVVITEMPRKNEIQSEEPAVSSPLRRSSRAAAGNGGTPSSVKSRRASLLAQEENVESKPAPRTRRGNDFLFKSRLSFIQ